MGRGLHNFIRDLKNAATPEKESKRVQEELSKIRAKFRGEKELDTYNKKKYVWKLLYIHMLGYEVDFGVVEAIHLLALPGYGEKACGYLAVSLLLDDEHELIQLVINSLRNDLRQSLDSNAPECHCLALGLLSNLGAGQFMEELCPMVTELMVDAAMKPFVRKKAALCLVNMTRRQGDADMLNAAEMVGHVLQILDTSNNLGLCTAVMSLMVSLTSRSQEGWDEAPRVVISLLTRTRQNERNFAKGYTYFQIPSPWIQIKCMRSLQFFPPFENGLARKQLLDQLTEIITKTDIAKKNQNKINALHAIFFEAINLCSHYCTFDDAEGGNSDTRELLLQAVDHLGRFLTDDKQAATNKNLKLCNVRYLALDAMSRLAVIPGGAQHLKQFTESFIISLQDDDMGIRSRALDVLYEMADKSTAAKIVDRFLEFLGDAENEVKEELVLKVAILAERWATKFDWYVDVILRLIEVAGDVVSDDIWYRVVFIVTNNEPHNPGLHKYAAQKVFDAVNQDVANERTVKVAAYLLGEFGYHIAQNPDTSFACQFEILNSKFAVISNASKAVVLNTFIKLRNNDPSLDARVREVLESCCSHFDQEIQQRACEYVMFSATADANPELMPTVLEAMDFFPDRDNPLVQRLLDADSHGQEAEHYLQKKRDKADLDPAESVSSEPPVIGVAVDPEPEPEAAVSVVGDLLGIMEPPRTALSVAVEAPVVEGDTIRTDAFNDAQMGAQGVQVCVMPDVLPPRAEQTAVDPSVMAAFYTKDKGRIFKDEQCEIGAIVQPGRLPNPSTLTFFCANLSDASEMLNFTVEVAGSPSIKVVTTQAAPPTLGPRQQKKHIMQVQCVAPYESPPSVRVSFIVSGGGQRVVTFLLPLPMNKFIEGVPLEPAAFMSTWGKVAAGPPLEMQAVTDQRDEIGAIESRLVALGLSVVANLDPKPENRVFAAKFGSVPIMLRLEGHAASRKIRFTIRSTNAIVSCAILKAATL